MILKIRLTKINFFIITGILFIPLIVMFMTWTIITFQFFTLKYYPLSVDNPTLMSSYYSNYQESYKIKV